MATINQIELRVNLRANNNEKSDQFGRLYAELDRNRTLSLRGLAKHISELCRFARKETSPKGEAFVSLRLRLLGAMHLGRKNILQFILSFARF